MIKPTSDLLHRFARPLFQMTEKSGIYPPEFGAVFNWDPELGDGSLRAWRAVLQVQVRVEADNGAKVGVIEPLLATIYRREEYGIALTLKLTLQSDKDLFFLYRVVIGTNNYEQLRHANEFELPLAEFAGSFAALFARIVANPDVFFLLLTVLPEGSAQLEIHQNLQYKSVSVLKLILEYGDRASINQAIMYRYSVLLAKSLHLQRRLREVGALLRTKNPALLTVLQRQFRLD